MADEKSGSVLVTGAGIGGIKAAIDLAERGRKVLLAESSAALGGILSQLDQQFPNNHCGLCRMLPAWERDAASDYCMRKGLFHENIRILPMTELTRLEGQAGAFEAVLTTRHRGVDTARCIGCGRCEEACPVEVEDAFNEGLARRKAVHRQVPHNVPFSYAVDFEACTRCGECVSVCPTGAIQLEGEPVEETVGVGAVILAPGCGLYHPSTHDAWQYDTLPDVITGLELERMLSGSGPTGGALRRPSDGKPVESVAWIQCVGSRNAKLGQDFCSSICCMFALKETMLVRENSPGTACAVFYMDLRAFGKEGYRYQVQAREQGAELIQCRVHAVETDPRGGMYIKYYVEDEGVIRERPFDLVVLSTGQAGTPEMRKLADVAGVSLNSCGFAQGEGLYQTASDRPGVFWCGSATGLKDITETVLQAESAALLAAQAAGAPPAAEENRDERRFRDVSRELPRTGVLLCRCFESRDLPWDEIKDGLEADHDVTVVVEGDRLCRAEGFQEALAALQGQKVNRVVIGACTPYVVDRRLRKLGAGLGLSEDLVEVVDLRSVGLGPGEDSLKRRQALSAVAAGVQKQKNREFHGAPRADLIPAVLVLGGGLAGMTTALSMADQGLAVKLVEKSGGLGGETARRRYSLDGTDPAAFLKDLEERVLAYDNINVFKEAELTGLSGEAGRYAARIRLGDGKEEALACGAIVLATGGREAATSEYHYDESEKILTQGELEKRLHEGALAADDLKRVVMIQCVGSREEGRPYCSRICCSSALKNAEKILEVRPDADIYILYRDLMSYGFMESRYRELREKGVQFINYTPESRPEVRIEGGGPAVIFREPVLGVPAEVHPDLLVLSTGVVPADHRELARLVGVSLNQDGFFQEMDAKWRPVDLSRPGIFACGLALAPRNMSETVLHAHAAAVRAGNLLRRGAISGSRTASAVRHALCSRCGTCITVCPFEARYLDKDRIQVIASACQGCGMCAAACPNGAAWLPLATDRQTMGMIEGLLDSFS